MLHACGHVLACSAAAEGRASAQAGRMSWPPPCISHKRKARKQRRRCGHARRARAGARTSGSRQCRCAYDTVQSPSWGVDRLAVPLPGSFWRFLASQADPPAASFPLAMMAGWASLALYKQSLVTASTMVSTTATTRRHRDADYCLAAGGAAHLLPKCRQPFGLSPRRFVEHSWPPSARLRLCAPFSVMAAGQPCQPTTVAATCSCTVAVDHSLGRSQSPRTNREAPHLSFCPGAPNRD